MTLNPSQDYLFHLLDIWLFFPRKRKRARYRAVKNGTYEELRNTYAKQLFSCQTFVFGSLADLGRAENNWKGGTLVVPFDTESK